MTTGRLAAVITVLALGGALVLGTTRDALAQAALPYMAYGSGLAAGQSIEALVGTTSVGQTSADRFGQWRLPIEPSASVKNGDHVTFSLDGTPTSKSITFQSGQFPRPPGIQLGVAPAATPTPAATSTPKPMPRATPKPATTPSVPGAIARPTPRATSACTLRGMPIACAAPPRTSTPTR